MKDTIEVPVELVNALRAWATDSRYVFPELASALRHLPTPKLVLELCPACGSEMELTTPVVPHHTFARCTNGDCKVEGPTNDLDGSKFNAMARPARVLRELMAKLIDDEFDSTDEVIYHLREAQKP